jgi:hypothetical protein
MLKLVRFDPVADEVMFMSPLTVTNDGKLTVVKEDIAPRDIDPTNSKELAFIVIKLFILLKEMLDPPGENDPITYFNDEILKLTRLVIPDGPKVDPTLLSNGIFNVVILLPFGRKAPPTTTKDGKSRIVWFADDELFLKSPVQIFKDGIETDTKLE